MNELNKKRFISDTVIIHSTFAELHPTIKWPDRDTDSITIQN